MVFSSHKGSWTGFALVLLVILASIGVFALIGYSGRQASAQTFLESRARLASLSSYQLTVHSTLTTESTSSTQLSITYSQGDHHHRSDNILQEWETNTSEKRVYVVPNGTYLCERLFSVWDCVSEHELFLENTTSYEALNRQSFVRVAKKSLIGRSSLPDLTLEFIDSGVIRFLSGPKKQTILGRPCNEVSYELLLDRADPSALEYFGSVGLLAGIIDKVTITTCLDAESGLSLYTLMLVGDESQSTLRVEAETLGLDFGGSIPESVFELPG